VIFEAKERSDKTPAFYMEGGYEFLDRSSMPEAEIIRSFLNHWVYKFPEEEAKELVARIKSRDVRHFDSSVFEIQLFAIMSGLKCKVDIHPTLENDKKTKPDFLITTPDNDQFYLEAIVATGMTEIEKSAEKRMSTVLDAINTLESNDFFLGIKANGNPDSPPSGRKLRRALNTWIKTLKADEIIERYNELGRIAIPTKVWEQSGWKIHFEAIPKAPEKRKPSRLIGMQTSQAVWDGHTNTIKTALTKKASKYGKLGKPLVVATNIASVGVDSTDEMQALFGEEVFRFDRESGEVRFVGRKPNGVWFGKTGDRYRRLSGAWIFRNLNAWNMENSKNILYLNSKAYQSVPDTMLQLTHSKENNGEMLDVKGLSISELSHFD
jgi:hypothetical protein